MLIDAYNGKFNTWDYQWLFSQWFHDGLSVIPNVNFISNIGFGVKATNTTNSSETTPFANRSISGITFPLKHPANIIAHKKADTFTQKTRFDPSFLTRVKLKLHRAIKIKRK
ncbi:hypothetical protein [Calothrix sp. PCC 6303]|uniref:hypothetical protein n=1 Tax=Calothrix sp. PCC 6303 TaxID=1170562 RepID=UPI00031D27D0|nr:hypothetical protein [Calothrix sp. PCC 6303]